MNEKKNFVINIYKVACIACACFFIAGTAHAEWFSKANEKDINDSSYDLYLLIGQSNMAGRGVITEKYEKEGDPHVFMLNKENKWVTVKNHLHFDKPSVAGVGPGLSFGIRMEKKNRGNKIGLIPCAVGGTSISVWQPGAYDSATKTHPFDDMLLRLNEAQKSGTLKGIIWLQGESDSNPAKAEKYLNQLAQLIKRIRIIAGNNELAFVAGELGQYKPQYKNINNVLKKLPDTISNTAVAPSKGLKDKGDNTHFNSASAVKMGTRMAKKMIQLQNL